MEAMAMAVGEDNRGDGLLLLLLLCFVVVGVPLLLVCRCCW